MHCVDPECWKYWISQAQSIEDCRATQALLKYSDIIKKANIFLPEQDEFFPLFEIPDEPDIDRDNYGQVASTQTITPRYVDAPVTE